MLDQCPLPINVPSLHDQDPPCKYLFAISHQNMVRFSFKKSYWKVPMSPFRLSTLQIPMGVYRVFYGKCISEIHPIIMESHSICTQNIYCHSPGYGILYLFKLDTFFFLHMEVSDHWHVGYCVHIQLGLQYWNWKCGQIPIGKPLLIFLWTYLKWLSIMMVTEDRHR